MLLDIHAIKEALLHLPGSETTQSYTKLVNKQIARIETFLKVLLSTPSPPQGLVQNYLFLIKDKNSANFIKILDIKGIPKAQQSTLLNLFITSIQTYEGELEDRNLLLTNLQLQDARLSEDRKLDAGSFFRDQLGIGSSNTASQQISRANTPAPGAHADRFGAHLGKLFSKRSVSGMNLSGSLANNGPPNGGS